MNTTLNLQTELIVIVDCVKVRIKDRRVTVFIINSLYEDLTRVVAVKGDVLNH